jgi:general secretion pathway protein D
MTPKELAGFAPSDAVASTVSNADVNARSPMSTNDRTSNASNLPSPMLFPGTDPDSVAPASGAPDSQQRVASAEPVALRGDGVEMNFDGTDIASAAKTLLGDILHLNFQIDPRVQGNITLASIGPLPRKDVLPAFESALRMQNAAIVHDHDFIKIVPISEASAHSSISTGAGEPGYGVSVVPLRYVSATSAAKTAENLAGRSGAIKVDQARNLLLVQGTESERQAAIDVISTFDVEWLRNQSVGVYPLKSTSPETMIGELERVFETGDGGPGQGVVQFQPISRMNAVMVVTKNPDYLKQTTRWVQRLDRADTSGTMVRTYRLRYGNASEVAKMLTSIFGGDQSSGANDSPANQIAPGSSTTESRLDSLERGSQNSNSTTQPNATQASPSTAINAAFSAFSKSSDTKSQSQNATLLSGGNASRGVLENVRITADTVNNAVLVYSTQEQYRVVERALRDVDRPRLEVAIDATVAEVTLTNQLQYGVQYYLNNQNVSVGFLGAAQSVASTVLQSTSPGFNLLLGSQGNPKVILNALSGVTDVRVLSSPSIVALDNQPALLQVGDEVPVSTGTATVLTNANTPIVNQIELLNTGVILKVLPHVNANGSIQLEIDQEVSSVPNTSQQTLTPTISQRRIHSTVAVMSGQTVLLGGLISDSTQNSRDGVPGLSDIKVLGALFGTTNSNKTRSEIIIFVRPQLIRNSVDARAVTQEFRDKLQSMKSTRSVVHPLAGTANQ